MHKDNDQGNAQRFDVVGAIMRYEGGEMSEEETIEFFQRLVDSGLAWSLQGHYGRAATTLIQRGLVSRK